MKISSGENLAFGDSFKRFDHREIVEISVIQDFGFQIVKNKGEITPLREFLGQN